MYLDIEDIGPGPLQLDRMLDLGPLEDEDAELLAATDVRLVGEARRGASGVELQGRLAARLTLQCSRCLEPFEEPLSVEFLLTIVHEAVEFGPAEARVEEGDTTLFYATEGRADLRAVAREQIYLNLPLKPICGPECRGLCPTCGANRNRLECACRREQVDPRLSPLVDIKRKLGDH